MSLVQTCAKISPNNSSFFQNELYLHNVSSNNCKKTARLLSQIQLANTFILDHLVYASNQIIKHEIRHYEYIQSNGISLIF